VMAAQVAAQKQQEVEREDGLLALNIRSCNNVTDLCLTCDMHLYSVDNKLCCNACFHYASQMPAKLASGQNRQTIGVFDPSQLFKNLKYAVKVHMGTAAHQWCVERMAQQELALRRRKSVGITVARVAYFVIREGMSYYSFERMLLEQHLLQVYIGTKNHSRKFVAEFLDSMHGVFVARTKKFLSSAQDATERKPLFAIVADKGLESLS
jgi:hypothetical protein